MKDKIQKSIQSVRGPDGGFTKVIEEAGTPVGQLVSTSSTQSCNFVKKCLVGESGCQTPNIIYEVTCTDCPSGDPVDPPSVYIGTSGANIHHRSTLHRNDISAKKPGSSLYKHNMKYHIDTHTDANRFKFKQISTHPTVMNRLLTEAHSIAHDNRKLMNSKNEYGAGKWVSLVTDKFST